MNNIREIHINKKQTYGNDKYPPIHKALYPEKVLVCLERLYGKRIFEKVSLEDIYCCMDNNV